MKSCHPANVPAWQKGLNAEVVLISEFIHSEIRITSQFFVELMIISEITNLEIRITPTLRYFCQADRISILKTSNYLGC